MSKRIISPAEAIICLLWCAIFYSLANTATTFFYQKYTLAVAVFFPAVFLLLRYARSVKRIYNFIFPEKKGEATGSAFSTNKQQNITAGKHKEPGLNDLLNRKTVPFNTTASASLIKGKRVLITGAAGSIGSEIAKQVAALHPEMLIVCDQNETGLYELEYALQYQFNLGQSLKIYVTNITNRAAVTHIFTNCKPDIIFHAAAYKHVPIMELHPCEAIHNNVYGTKVLADLAELFEVERFLLISSDKAVNPVSVMGASKRIAEMYCHALQSKEAVLQPNNLLTYLQEGKKTKFIITRFGNVLCSGGSVVPRFQQQIAMGGPVTVTHPAVSHYFMTVQEACSLVLEAVNMGKGGEVFLFDMGKPVSILELAQKMIRQAGHEPDETMAIRFTGLRRGEKLEEELLSSEEEMLPTHHPKILVAKVSACDYRIFKPGLMQLLKLAGEHRTTELISQLKHMLPEYNYDERSFALSDVETAIKTKVISFN